MWQKYFMDVGYLVIQNSKKLIFKGIDLIKLVIITNVLIFFKCETEFFTKRKIFSILEAVRNTSGDSVD